MSKYIDADWLKDNLYRRCNNEVKRNGYPEEYGLIDFIEMLNYAPATDVAEVRHGRWIDIEPAPHNLFYATCSVCGDRQTIEVANYCPMCGASMDEVTE